MIYTWIDHEIGFIGFNVLKVSLLLTPLNKHGHKETYFYDFHPDSVGKLILFAQGLNTKYLGRNAFCMQNKWGNKCHYYRRKPEPKLKNFSRINRNRNPGKDPKGELLNFESRISCWEGIRKVVRTLTWKGCV